MVELIKSGWSATQEWFPWSHSCQYGTDRSDSGIGILYFVRDLTIATVAYSIDIELCYLTSWVGATEYENVRKHLTWNPRRLHMTCGYGRRLKSKLKRTDWGRWSWNGSFRSFWGRATPDARGDCLWLSWFKSFRATWNLTFNRSSFSNFSLNFLFCAVFEIPCRFCNSNCVTVHSRSQTKHVLCEADCASAEDLIIWGGLWISWPQLIPET
jgi:hypothetical protein